MSMDEIKIGVDIRGFDLRVLQPTLHSLVNAYLKKIGADPVLVSVKQHNGDVSIEIERPGKAA